MKEKIVVIFKGFIVGIANIIPGISGGTIALILGIYEQLIDILADFKKQIKKQYQFLILLAIGAVIGIAACSNLLSYCLAHYSVPTNLLFVGIVLGGLPMLFKHTKGHRRDWVNYLVLIISASLVILFDYLQVGDQVVSFSNMNLGSYLMLFIVGAIGASAMVIPGISGSFTLMLLGYYEPIIKAISDLTHFNNFGYNFIILFIFGIGIIVGIVGISKLIKYLLNKYEIKFYFGIIGFVLASIYVLISNMNFATDALQIMIGVLLLIGGLIGSKKLGDKE